MPHRKLQANEQISFNYLLKSFQFWPHISHPTRLSDPSNQTESQIDSLPLRTWQRWQWRWPSELQPPGDLLSLLLQDHPHPELLSSLNSDPPLYHFLHPQPYLSWPFSLLPMKPRLSASPRTRLFRLSMKYMQIYIWFMFC